jgi:hypothetical protein
MKATIASIDKTTQKTANTVQSNNTQLAASQLFDQFNKSETFIPTNSKSELPKI